MAQKYVDTFGTRKELKVGSQSYDIFRLDLLEKAGLKGVSRLPVSLKVLLENLLRQEDNHHVNRADIEALASWKPTAKQEKEIAFNAGTHTEAIKMDFEDFDRLVKPKVLSFTT